MLDTAAAAAAAYVHVDRWVSQPPGPEDLRDLNVKIPIAWSYYSVHATDAALYVSLELAANATRVLVHALERLAELLRRVATCRGDENTRSG